MSIDIIPYKGEKPLKNYIHGRSCVSHIVFYECGMWMCCDVPKIPAFCPQCGKRMAGVHEMTQEAFEHYNANITINKVNMGLIPQIKKPRRNKSPR